MKQAAEKDTQQICLEDQMTWFLVNWVQVIESTEEDHWGRSRGEALMAQLMLSDISNSQMAFFSSANRIQSSTEKAAT